LKQKLEHSARYLYCQKICNYQIRQFRMPLRPSHSSLSRPLL